VRRYGVRSSGTSRNQIKSQVFDLLTVEIRCIYLSISGPNLGFDAASPRLLNQRISPEVSTMAFSLSNLGAGFVAGLRFLFSAKGIPTWKGTLAYVICYILAFINPFTDLIAAPPQVSGVSIGSRSRTIIYLSSIGLMIIVVLAVAGAPVGLCMEGMIWIILGIMSGALSAYILANLAGVLVAQGVVYFILVYGSYIPSSLPTSG